MNEDGSIAKISDFSQARFRPTSVMYLSTMAPGCLLYTPPECLVKTDQKSGAKSRFTDKGDIFSLGVLLLQIATQERPSVDLVIIKGQPEVERRAADLAKLPEDHPLRSIILQCLQDDPAKRPSCHEVLHYWLLGPHVDIPSAKKVVPIPSATDVCQETDDEVLLQQLCYMATAVKLLIIGPDGGTFTLGSGDASLVFPPGAVEKETAVRYAMILHGPFMFSLGYIPVSVVVYINMEGAILMKPIQLLLSHWCNRKVGDDEDNLKFAIAPHTLGKGQEYYEFGKQLGGDFTTHSNLGILEISKPQCLHCVRGKPGMIANYKATTVFRNTSIYEDAFRIQFMCDSVEWEKCLTQALRQDGWGPTRNFDDVTRFSYTSEKESIAARPQELQGRGWTAGIHGNCTVKLNEFVMPKAKLKCEVERAISRGQCPPYIQYFVSFDAPKEKRLKPAILRVKLQGDDLDLRFSFSIMEEMSVHSPVASLGPSAHSPSQEATGILEKHEDEFFSCVNAKCNVLMLKRKRIVSPDVVSAIQTATDKEAKEILYDHLISHASKDTLIKWCEWAIDADGHPNMQEFGRKLMDELT